MIKYQITFEREQSVRHDIMAYFARLENSAWMQKKRERERIRIGMGIGRKDEMRISVNGE
jgi:hypothetical protein